MMKSGQISFCPASFHDTPEPVNSLSPGGSCCSAPAMEWESIFLLVDWILRFKISLGIKKSVDTGRGGG